MATPLRIQSFATSNIGERTALAGPASIGGTTVQVESSPGYAFGDVLYVGTLSREGCERVVVASIPDATHLALTAPLTLPHGQFEPVTAVLGDRIRIYRALNVDGKVPADSLFSVLATRAIDPDQELTWYTDSSGSSNSRVTAPCGTHGYRHERTLHRRVAGASQGRIHQTASRTTHLKRGGLTLILGAQPYSLVAYA